MKNYFFKILKSVTFSFGFVAIISISFNSCAPEDLTYRTFEGELIYTYLKNDTTQTYSEFVKAIDKVGLKGMLSAYGEYTCLAPTNTALKEYYARLGAEFTFDSLTEAQLDTLVKTHIISGKYLTYDLDLGVIPTANMNNRYIEVKYDTLSGKVVFNDSSVIVLRDVEVYNGVIQGLNKVLSPSNVQLPGLIASNENLSIFTKALELTGLQDSLMLIEDKEYANNPKIKEPYYGYSGYKNPLYLPQTRKFGYTAFVETDDLFAEYGINNVNDLLEKTKEWYPPREGEPVVNDLDYTSPYNSLNKFISYHLINKTVQANNFFFIRNPIQGYVPDEYLETMLDYRLIRLSMMYGKVTLNHNTDFTAHVLDNESKTTLNGVYHILDDILVYSEGDDEGTVEQMFSNTRIRFDATSLFPELMSNNLRGTSGGAANYSGSLDICGMLPGYLTGLTSTSDTRLQYLSSKGGPTYQADAMEFFGAYDLTVRLLPVPPGTYEIRFGYTVFANRGISQIYIDNKPIGIPLDLAISLKDPKIGAIVDSETPDNGVENDKNLRNRGYMKGPNTIWYDYNNSSARNYIAPTMGASRRIIGVFSFSDYEAHTLRFRQVSKNTDMLCILDYFEIVPKSVFNRADGEPETRD